MKTEEYKPNSEKNTPLETPPTTAKGEYYISIQQNTLHHLSIQQLQTFTCQINQIQKHITPSTEQSQTDKKEKINIREYTQWDKKENTPFSYYNINSPHGEIAMISFAHLKQISETLQQIIQQHNTQTDPTTPPIPSGKHTAPISEIDRQQNSEQLPLCYYSETNITKRTSYSPENRKTEYLLTANEQSSEWISQEQLSHLQQQLMKFLEKAKK